MLIIKLNINGFTHQLLFCAQLGNIPLANIGLLLLISRFTKQWLTLRNLTSHYICTCAVCHKEIAAVFIISIAVLSTR